MTSSFPFFNIAKKHGISYQEVMQIWQGVVKSLDSELGLECVVGVIQSDVALAELAERKRRAEIESFM